MTNKTKYKRDLILILVCVAVAAAAYIFMNYVIKKNGNYAVIKVDGKVINTLELDKDTTLNVTGYQGGTNIVTIKGGRVKMTEADCPDELCVKTGWVSRTGETIVCLPHRVVVEITGSNDDDAIDSIVR